MPLSSGVNLPKGELPDGQEFPNHACPNPDSTPSHEGCSATIKINTINDAEECCRFCKELSWLAPNSPNLNGDATLVHGKHVNPCVAWQIVEGRCRITRKAYFDHWNPGQTILAAITDSDFQSPGNTNWVIPTRGCGTSLEACNYFSYIYYREMNRVTAPTADEVNATYRKIVRQTVLPGTETINVSFSVTSLQSRQDTRRDLVLGDNGQPVIRNAPLIGVDNGGTDCGRIEVYTSQAIRHVGDYHIFDEESGVLPICTSDCISFGKTELNCTNVSHMLEYVQEVGGSTAVRRLSKKAPTAQSIFISFTSTGSGYDKVNYETSIDETMSTTTTTMGTAPITITTISSTVSSTTTSASATSMMTFSTIATTTSTTTEGHLLETLISTDVEVFDPTAFNTTTFAVAMERVIGILGASVEAKVKGFQVGVTYELSASVSKVQATTAIAAANNVPEIDVEVSIIGSGRRLATLPQSLRHLATVVEAKIKTGDAEKARIVKSSSTMTVPLKAEFANVGISVEPVVKVAPKVVVQVETKVVSAIGMVVQTPNAAQLAVIGNAVGGTVTVIVKTTTTVTAVMTTSLILSPTTTTTKQDVYIESSSGSLRLGGLGGFWFVQILGFCSYLLLA